MAKATATPSRAPLPPHLLTRRVAMDVVDAVIGRGQTLDLALQPLERDSGLDGKDRAFARAMAMLVLRRCGEIDAVIERYVQHPLGDRLRPVQHILRVGIAQLAWLGTPPHAAIHTSVELCKALSFVQQAGMVNAVLNKVSKALPLADAPTRNVPLWLRQSWEKAYGVEAASQVVQALIEEPLLDVRVKENAEAWAETFEGRVLNAQMVRVPNGRVEAMAGYDDGAWWVQDFAASLPVMLLGDVRGKRVLDVCAAPGGKTAQLCADGAQVVALDRNKKRLERLNDNMRRLQFEPEVVCADALEWKPDEPFDAVLIDAPCSATGTLRRHPDILYQRRPEDVESVLPLQAEMLLQACDWLKPDGVMVYCVCSLQREEGEAQIAKLLHARTDMQLQRIDPAMHGFNPKWVNADGMLRTLPQDGPESGGMDGFFAAVLVRR